MLSKEERDQIRERWEDYTSSLVYADDAITDILMLLDDLDAKDMEIERLKHLQYKEGDE
ncbi:hypothetical protein [Effusibacillus dendaii]|uniref:Uncharacterized protein n=1 Tax=Effusibacillus dendaii TaxID=2743772 RepID=A0A7I8D8S3_9BACL|nr:hypothetical protein [Effusibacillus dendaii]BCJ86485.1 hypothetical protein skT53_14700 [Effusibacillus dendaii]